MISKNVFPLALIFVLTFLPVVLAGEIENRLTQASQWTQTGNYEKAVEEYQQILKIDKKNKDAHLSLGLLYAQLGNYNKAVDHAKKATELNPSYASFYNLGLIYAAKKEPEKALQALDKALEMNPQSYQAEFQKGAVYASQEAYEKAAEAYRQAIKLNPLFADAYVGLGGALYKQGLKQEALEQVEALRKIGRKDSADALEQWIQKKDAGG